MGFTPIEKKIFICSLGIVLITLLCYVVFNRLNRVREPLPPFAFPENVIQLALSMVGQIRSIITTIISFVGKRMTDIKIAANHASAMAKAQANKIEVKADAAAKHIESKSDRALKFSMQRARDAANATKNSAERIAQSAKNRAYQASKDAKESITTTKGIRRTFSFFRKYWKYIAAFFFFLSNVGQWCITNVITMIYRIASFKNCFLWYFLEIIGWVLYIPIEFFVWLFCLKDLETMVWDLMKQLDCSFNDITGFHFMYYSDTVIKKCYSRKFKPFPKMNFDFTLKGLEKEGGKFILDFLLPITPDEAKQIAKAGAKEAEKLTGELKSSFTKIPSM